MAGQPRRAVQRKNGPESQSGPFPVTQGQHPGVAGSGEAASRGGAGA
jgi:hypothetical protein